jgi:hypothetical protein
MNVVTWEKICIYVVLLFSFFLATNTFMDIKEKIAKLEVKVEKLESKTERLEKKKA